MDSANNDVEQGRKVARMDHRVSSIDTTAYRAHEHMSTQLEVFQVLVGIRTPAEISGGHRVLERATFYTQTPIQPKRSSSVSGEQDRPRFQARRLFFPPPKCKNIGLYQRAITEEWKNRIGYLVSSIFINLLYLVQILLAATFTALSAYEDAASVTLTVLGAINTVIAGILAWVKGRGMPNRFRKARDQYGAIVQSIEMTERMFAEYAQLTSPANAEAASLDPRTEKDRLEKMFEMARHDQQANYPDMYVERSEKTEAIEKLEEVRSGADRTKQDLEAKVDLLTKELQELRKSGSSGLG